MSFGQSTVFRYLIDDTQSVAFTGTAGTISTAIGQGVYHVRVMVTGDAHIQIGASPTATTSHLPIAANSAEIMMINPGEKVSAIQQSGGSGGTLYVTPCTH